MKISQKGSVGVCLPAVIVILLIVLGYLLYMKRPVVEKPRVTSSENQIIHILLADWKNTQEKFTPKAGEGGIFNSPSRIQFISADTMLVYYNDGLVDHVSVVQFKNGIFVELKNVGVMSTVSQGQRQSLVSAYGDSTYRFSNYQSGDYNQLQLTPDQIFTEFSAATGLHSKLDYLRMYGQDKIEFKLAGNYLPSFAYRLEGGPSWISRGGSDCSAYDDFPEEYRPVCYDSATKKNKYADAKGESVNYPRSGMISYMGQ